MFGDVHSGNFMFKKDDNGWYQELKIIDLGKLKKREDY